MYSFSQNRTSIEKVSTTLDMHNAAAAAAVEGINMKTSRWLGTILSVHTQKTCFSYIRYMYILYISKNIHWHSIYSVNMLHNPQVRSEDAANMAARKRTAQDYDVGLRADAAARPPRDARGVIVVL